MCKFKICILRNELFEDCNIVLYIQKALKCHYDEILDIHFFYIFGHNRSFLDFLPNFNLLRTLEQNSRCLDLYF